MAEPTYVYEGRIERGSGAIRTAYLPAESEPVYFGVHGAIAQHYGLYDAVNDEDAFLRFHLATHVADECSSTCLNLPRCPRGGKRAL